jgi:hypothetical protein
MPKTDAEKDLAPHQRLLNKFSQLYWGETGGKYSPTIIDRVNAKRFISDYTETFAWEMVKLFIGLVQVDPAWRKKNMTISSAYYHRNELYRRVIENLTKEKEEVRRDDWEI